MVAVNLNTESQAEIGKKGKANNAAGDLFTQLLNNALEKQKQPTVLDPKQAMQNAQKGDFGALTQEVLKGISKKSEPQNAQDSQKLNNANKAYSKAQEIKEQPQPVVLREDSAKEQTEAQKTAPQTANKDAKAETNAKDVAQKDTKESAEAKEQKTAKAEKTEKEDKQAESKDAKLKKDDEKPQDSKQKTAGKDVKIEAKDSKEKIATKEQSKGEETQNRAKEKLAETKQEMQKTNDDILTSMLRNSKQMLKDSKEIAEKEKDAKNKEIDAKESGKAKEAKNAKESKESAKTETKDVKVANDSKEKLEPKQAAEDSKTLRETKNKETTQAAAKVVSTKTAQTSAQVELANLLNFRTSTQKELKEDLQNTITEQKERLANTNPQDSLFISNRLAKIIEKLLVRYQSDDPNAIAGALKHGMQLASLSAEDSKALAQINAELSQKGISLREILLQALEELNLEEHPKNAQTQTKESLPTNNANAQKVMTQLVQDIKDNLRDTILGFIGKENKEMPQTILGMSKGVSNAEFATDIKDVVQKLETMLRETLRLEESETKAIGKEILIQNLLKDSNTTKIAFDKKDLVLMRAQSLVQAPQNQNTQSKEVVQNEILNKILNGSTMSLSLLKELAGSFANYQEQEQWLQKFAEFANVNLKNFQYSSLNSTPIFSELGAKNPLLSALLQGNMELQKTLFDYAKEAQGGKAPSLAAPIPSRFVPNTAPAPKESDIKHPLTAKLAELNAKTAAMVGAKPDYTPNEGKMTLEELLARERLAIQNAVEQTKAQTIMQQPNAAESSIAKTLQAFKEEIYKEVFNKKNDEQSEEETILSNLTNKTTKTTDKKASVKTSSATQNNTQSLSASEDRYRQNSASSERPNPTHSNQNTTSETLKWEQNEYDKKQASQQEAQRLHNQNTTLLTPEAKKQAASAGAGKTILDVLGAKITQSAQPKEAMPQAVVIDSKADILYRSAAAKETLRNFTGSLREGINNYKPPLSKLSIELSPEHLGNVEVTLKQRGAQLIVQIHSNPQALQLFMANAQDFKQQLFGIGYENVEMTFQDADGNTYGEGGGNGGNGGGQNGENGEQRRQNEHEHEESTLEEMQMRQEMAQEIVGNGKTWNTFGLQAYKNSDSVIQKLRFLELTLTPKYA